MTIFAWMKGTQKRAARMPTRRVVKMMARAVMVEDRLSKPKFGEPF